MRIRKLIKEYLLVAAVAVLIITFAIIKKQSFIKTLPTLVTLVVQIILAKANRYGFLLGGINSIIYGIAFLSESLYFSVISTMLISAPIQLYSFFNWGKKQTSNNHTELKKLSLVQWIIILILTLGGWAVCYYGLAPFFKDALLPGFDTFHFGVGIIVSVLAARRYFESQYINAFTCVTNIIMWVIICVGAPSNINYLIISFYNLYMVLRAAVNWTRQYIEDKKSISEQVSK